MHSSWTLHCGAQQASSQRCAQGSFDQLCFASFNEELTENGEEAEEGETLDAIHSPADLGSADRESIEKTVEHEETLEQLEKEANPEQEKVRRAEWRRLTKAERVGIRRLHHMTSHATKPQMMRMLKYANAARHVVRAVKHFRIFRCPSCDRIEPEKQPQAVKPLDPYAFNETTGMDIFTIQDAFGDSFQILHIMCTGTNLHCAEVIGPSQGVFSCSKCLQSILRIWVNWAGMPRYMLFDRGTHNRGIMMTELEKRGCTFRMIGLEAPYQLGKIERAGGVLKSMCFKHGRWTRGTLTLPH